MISKTALNARGQNKNGESVIDYLMVTEAFKPDYYHGEEQSMMRWGGKGAIDLGLSGDVEREQMMALAAGFHPTTKGALCQNAGEQPKTVTITNKDGSTREKMQGGHRVGFDFTFTPAKDVSLLFALSEGEEQLAVLTAHRRAVQKSMEFLESMTETRRGRGGKDVIGVDGLVYSEHDHTANRNLEPNLHTHTLIFGVAQGSDCKWGTYDAKELYRHTRTADVIYQNELACNLRELGYNIEQREETLKNGEVVRRAGIAGIEQRMMDGFSTRRAEILAYQEEHGVSAQAACLATRKHKDEPSHAELKVLWAQVSTDLGYDPAMMSGLKDQGQDKRLEATSLQALGHALHTSEAAVCQTDLIKLIGNENMGFMRFEEILTAVEAFKGLAGLRVVAPKQLHEHDKGKTLSREHSEDRYQAPWMAQVERQIVESAKSRESETHLSLKSETVDHVFAQVQLEKGFTLSMEQKAAVRHLTTETQGVAVIEGYAGSGKTSVAEIYKRAFEAEGYTLIGVAISNAAAKKLEEESGMQCRSVAKTLAMLDTGTMALTAKHVLVVDEAGMLDTLNTAKLMRHAEKVGAKVILQGDANQLQPIQAGSGFILAKGAIGSTKLTEIRRQESDDMRELARSYYDDNDELKSRREQVDKGNRVREGLERYGLIQDFQTHDLARKRLTSDYLENPAALDDKLILAHTRGDVATLTKDIRQELKRRGGIGLRDTIVKCKDGKQWEEHSFSEGDRIRFKATDDSLGVMNGTEGVVSRVSKSAWDSGTEFSVRVGDRTVRFSSYEYNALDHNYAVTVHGAQGQGKDHVYHLYQSGMADNQSMLVGFTRMKKDYSLYGQADELDGLALRAGQNRRKENALAVHSDEFKQTVERAHINVEQVHGGLGR